MLFQQILILLACVWLVGRIFDKLKWPPLFGEILAGIIVGPMILGMVEDTEAIRVLAEFGIFFLMLHAGLEMNPKQLYKASHRSVVVAAGGVMIPFLSGWWVSRAFGYELFESLFIGVGLSITAIAVTARLFKDYNITNSNIAHVTMGAAVIDDILGLLLFSIVLNIVDFGMIDITQISILTAKIVLFFLFVLFLGQKCSGKLNKIIFKGNKGFTFTIIIGLLFGVIAELIGLHVIIGAFLAGLFIREEVIEPGLYEKIEDRIYGLSYSFLGPIFFASLAFHLDFSALKTAALFTIAITLVAIIGKILGAGICAFKCKMTKIESLGVGLAMNSRGAVELIIASIGLQKGIISSEIFSILVIMAFATTLVSIIGLKPISNYVKSK
ncbi:MAG: cation:proton antiporter [Patescibacteria group bacterium]|nr:cation:proton antiporter [Patescibacteria group bacterium]